MVVVNVDNKMIIKVKHPDYGYVEFDNPTIRQQQILEEYNRLQKPFFRKLKNKVICNLTSTKKKP